MRIAPVLAALAALPVSAAAESVRVRSGEHATFSRLVFPSEEALEWTVERPWAGEARIAFMPSPDLDLTDVFARIPRTRLRGMTAGTGAVVLDLGCDCPVEVSQIGSGHIVIDVLDGEPLPERPAPVAVANALPFPLAPLPMTLTFPQMPAETSKPRHPPAPTAVTPDEPDDVPPQVRRMEVRDRPFVLPETRKAAKTPLVPSCDLESIASDILLRDPNEAFVALEGAMADVLDGEDRFEPDRLIDLAETYLAAGFGTEALQIADQADRSAPHVAALAAALDDLPRPDDARLDPACGPATTLVALLDTDPAKDWERADRKGLVAFVDQLPLERWRDLKGRLGARLAMVGEDDLLTGIREDVGTPELQVATDDATAAGTDAAAITAVRTILSRANEDGAASEDIHLVNAMALRSSIPPGPEKAQFDLALATAFALSRRPVETVDLVADGSVPADPVFDVVVTRLEPAVAAEFLARLRPHLSPERRADPRLPPLFAAIGLPGAAARFAGQTIPDRPREVTDAPATDPWLARDLVGMAEAADEAIRGEVSAAIVERNTTPLPETDLAAAERVLRDSERLGALLADLLAGDAPS
ncbi:hypothetical protein [uncultured Jannaschia sp.]|uniref:hypothetical protein n=1 Tax=uncultured Jannaschia sp. TaxID=293347 RepID=UPI0026130012|nr:hypothetical protein [uncultured Jannaschia sp.]